VIARTLVVALLLLAAVVLETALFGALTLFGFRPDLLLLVTAVIATRDGPMAGVRVGAVAGLLADLLVSSSPVGLGVFVYGVVGALVGWSRPYFAPTSVTAPLLLVGAASVVGTAAYGVLASLLADQRIGAPLVLQGAIAVGLYNTLLAPVVMAIVRRMSDAFPLRGTGAE
jgi:rod shape-determining protein MreD